QRVLQRVLGIRPRGAAGEEEPKKPLLVTLHQPYERRGRAFLSATDKFGIGGHCRQSLSKSTTICGLITALMERILSLTSTLVFWMRDRTCGSRSGFSDCRLTSPLMMPASDCAMVGSC